MYIDVYRCITSISYNKKHSIACWWFCGKTISISQPPVDVVTGTAVCSHTPTSKITDPSLPGTINHLSPGSLVIKQNWFCYCKVLRRANFWGLSRFQWSFAFGELFKITLGRIEEVPPKWYLSNVDQASECPDLWLTWEETSMNLWCRRFAFCGAISWAPVRIASSSCRWDNGRIRLSEVSGRRLLTILCGELDVPGRNGALSCEAMQIPRSTCGFQDVAMGQY